MSITMKYHNHTLQNNPRHREEEQQSTNSNKKPGRKSLFPIKMIAELERTLSTQTAQQNKDQLQIIHKQW